MRVVLDGRALAGVRAGGARYVRHLVRGLAQLGEENEYWLCAHREMKERPVQEGGNFHYRVDRYPLGSIWQNVALPRILKEVRADIFHSTLFTVPLRMPCPAVVTVFDLTPLLFPQWHTLKVRMTIRGLLGRSVRKARLVIVLSDSTRSDLIRLLGTGEEKIRVIPLGVDECFRPRGKDEPGVDEVRRRIAGGREYLLHVGTIEPRKNLALVVGAYARVRRQLGKKPPVLVLAGAGGWGMKGFRKQIEDTGCGEDIVQAGYVTEDELPCLYNGASAVLYPSFYEGFGLPPLEAMASGVPVLAADSSSLPGVVGSAALLLDPRDEAAWDAGIVRVFEDSDLRARLVSRGLEQAKKFSWERTARETLAVYGEALEQVQG